MAQQITTSVSDFALACSVFYVSFYLYNQSSVYASLGLLIQGAAASVGVFRFAMHHPEGTTIFRTHKLLSWLAAAAGMALIAYQFCLRYNYTNMGYIVTGFSALVIIMSPFQGVEDNQLFTQACSGLAVLTVLVSSFMNGNWNGIYAALIYILAGAIVGSEGKLVGIYRVDILHYALVVANFIFLKAFS